ncbi:MAG: DEAD/DEAH box helicase family protein [Prevotella sp.]|nr:DEAD/DEAH box helicase family protein [Prevotella sp.]
MRYKGKSVEIIGRQRLFDKETLWIHILDSDTFTQVLAEELEDDGVSKNGLAYARFIAIATKIKQEIAEKHILAPYESNLIPLPHQILVLEKVMQGVQTRFMLADEVGMGKTIEAGLVLKEKKLRGDVKRVLLIVPKSAMLQWQAEMKEHFAENFFIYDSDLINSMAKTFATFEAEEELNFWRQHNQIIVSSDALKPVETRQGWSQERVDAYNKYRLEMVVNADFDMVIIDEAHKMGGSTSSVSRFKMAEVLCNAVPNLLLLTATPHRGKSDHFRRVLQLMDADAFSGDGMPSIEEIQPYVMRSEKRYAVDYDGKKLFNERSTIRFDVTLSPERHALQLALYKHITDYVRTCFGRAKTKKRNATGLVMVMLQKLASSSTDAVLSALQTRLTRLENGEDEDDLEGYGLDGSLDYDDGELNVDDYSVEHSTSELKTEIEMLQKLIEEALECRDTETDAKTTALVEKIYSLRNSGMEGNNKVLVFTEFRQTQDYIIRKLTEQGLQCEKVHGSMTMEERHHALVRFRENADVLVATDAAGESLNMQFCHIVINYDLPWNPMALEQRIGRVDRIGQKYEVQAYNMLANNSIDYRIYSIIVEKLDLIMEELGIDKSSDVLDSTIDVKKINHLYLQSLLDPKRFEFASESWLYDIKQKLNEYRSTEGALPTISPEEINARSAAEVKYSPLPIWLENLMMQYCQTYGFQWRKNLMGMTEFHLGDGNMMKVTFDAENTENNPEAEQMTLRHPLIKQILNEVDGGMQGKIPVLQSFGCNETAGYLTIWKVSALNNKESKTTYTAQFITDNGRVFAPYANAVWNKLVQDANAFQQVFWQSDCPDLENNAQLQNNLRAIFHRMEESIMAGLQDIAQKKLRALDYTEQRLNRIGIENIRISKMRHLKKEREEWLGTFRKSSHVAPYVKLVMTVRIDG